jgi:Carboxypeptidase regulatory-like domain/TonB dependent receptor/TonB-dependent Receptor Plug Domain
MNPTLFKGLRHALMLSVALMGAPAMAQETAGQINGAITATNGQPLANAQVRIVHTPTGAVTSATTNAEGRFIGRGLRLGGPYEVTVTSPGGAPEKVQENVFLVLGEAYDLNYALGSAMEEITVSGVRVRDAVSGPVTDFDRERIVAQPTVTRDLKDVLRADPKVYIDRTNVDAIQIAGTNNRFNLLTIDGVRNNDDFGLNNGGYPGLRSPLSLDVIDQLSVNIAPYAVTYSGFQGGNINIVTKSGTNDFTGSAYYYYSDDGLAGKNSGARPVNLTFKDKTWGATLGGPIVEDKLFFFAGYEKFTTSTPITTGPLNGGFANSVTQVTQAEYTQISGIAQSVYGYDIGTLSSDLPETDEKIFGKINWNVTDDHNFVISYNRDKGNVFITPNVIPLTASAGSLGAGSNGYNNTQVVDSVSAQLFSSWTDEFKTEVKIGYKNQEANPSPVGKIPFPEMQVRTAAGGILAIGPDRSRHFNALTNELWTYKLKGDYLLGDHTITAGYEREELDVFNAFFQDAYGTYLFNSIADFQNRTAQQLVFANAISGNIVDAGATFAYNVNAFYLQDAWELNPDLTVTAGLRRERFSSNSVPFLNNQFLARNGFPNTETYDGRELWLPRVAFNYTYDDATTFRGGVGLFGGGSPNVWLSNSFSNTGVQAARVTITRPAAGGALTPVQTAALNGVTGTIPAAVQATLLPGNGDVNAIDPNFKMPSTWKASLGFDHTFDAWVLGDEWQLKGDLIYSRVKNGLLWRENRVIASGTAPDGRPLYQVRPGSPSGAPVTPPTNLRATNIAGNPLLVLPAYPITSTGNDLVMTNTDQGRGWVASLQLAKEWQTDIGRLNLELGYTWQDITEVSAATSSTAQSNWDNLATDDINNPKESTSNYEIKQNFVFAGQWTEAFWGDYETSVSFFGQARTGRPYSYTFAGNSRVFGDPRQGGRQRQLFYVPKDENDVILAGGLTYQLLNQYIEDNGLDKYRGRIVPRNAFRSPSVLTVDMRFSQDIPGLFEGSKGVFTMDIRNLTNMINSSWGRDIQIGFPFVAPVVEAVGISGGKYVYAPFNGRLNYPNRSMTARASVWAVQFGARYEF